MNQLRIALIGNPSSGNGRAARRIPLISQHFHNQGIAVDDYSADSFQEAYARADAGCGTRTYDALVVAGGDGMVHLGTNLAIRHQLPMGIIAIGSGNDIARSLELPRHKTSDSVQLICHHLTNQTPLAAVDVVQVTTPGHAEPHYYLGVLSLGLDAEANALANTYSWPRGSLKYVRALMRLLPRHKPYGFTITTASESRTTTSTVVAVANSAVFGGGLKVAPRASMTDGLLDVIYTNPLTRGQILRLFPKLYTGKHIKHPKVFYEQTTSLTISPSDGNAPVPPRAFADGEPMGNVPLEISVLPLALRVIGAQAS